MRKLTKKSLDELANLMPRISEFNQRTYVGGGNGSEKDPYSQVEFDAMCVSGTWQGGCVEGLGYVGVEVVISGDSQIASTSSGIIAGWMPSEGVGIGGSFNYSCTTNIESGTISIGASSSNPYLGSDAIMSGAVEVYVDGKLVSTYSLETTDNDVSQEGTTPLGTTSFDLTQYHGHVEIVVSMGCNYDSGAGIGSVHGSRVVYSGDR